MFNNINIINNFTNSYKNSSNLNLVDSTKTKNFQNYLDKFTKNNNKNEEDLINAAKDFESYFINMMFKQMRNTIDYSKGILKRSKAEEIFQEMLDEQISKDVTKFNSIGIADAIYKQLSNNKNNLI